MPRHLTVKQKKYIDSLISNGLTDIDEISPGQFYQLEKMNDFETLYQRVENYIWDKRMAGACDKTLKERWEL